MSNTVLPGQCVHPLRTGEIPPEIDRRRPSSLRGLSSVLATVRLYINKRKYVNKHVIIALYITTHNGYENLK